MGSIRRTQAAKEDLKGVWAYTVDRWGEAQAERYLAGIQHAFERLADLPMIGTVVTGDLRVWHHEKHRIFYRVTDNGIEIGRVVHHSRQTDPPSSA